MCHPPLAFVLLIRSSPLSQVTPGSKASLANLCPGDVILAIEGEPADGLTHGEAQLKIKDFTNQLTFKIER